MNRPAEHNGIVAAAGSYRDPSGFIVIDGDKVYRAVADARWPQCEEIDSAGTLQLLMGDGKFVRTSVVDPRSAEHARLEQATGCRHFYRHEKIEFLSFPYEWCFSMLADAGLLHLDLQRALLQKGFSLKDATAFNVQFVGA